MDLKQLGYFVKVVELGGFSRAAAYLHIAQPALSRQIRNLEIELKERLLIRNGRGVVTTEAGERLMGHARGVLRLVERTYEDIENARTGRSGKVAIGMPQTLSDPIATTLVRRLRTELPDATVHLLNGRSIQLQEWLLGGHLDMAVLYDAPNSPLLEIHPLVDEVLHLVSPPDTPGAGRPVTLREVANVPLILPSRPNRIREILETELVRLGLKLDVAFEVDSRRPTLDLVGDGMAHTVGSLRALRAYGGTRPLVARRITGPDLILRVQLALPARRLKNRLHDAAFRILRDLGIAALTPPAAA